MASPGRTAPPALAAALRDYVEARGAALLQARKALGIGELDARALLYIVDTPGARPGDVRGYLGITSAGVTTLVDRLVDRGAIRRDLHDEDRRMVRLTATVDLESEPWSALTAFDSGITRAIAALDRTAADAAGAVVRGLLRPAGS